MSTESFLTGLPRLLRLGLKFGMIGAASVLIYFGVLVALRPLVAHTVSLTAISYVVSAVFNYVLQSTYTFRAPAADARSVLRYLLLHGVCMAVNSVLMFVLVDVYLVGIVTAQVATTLVLASLSFVLSHFWIYAPLGGSGRA